MVAIFPLAKIGLLLLKQLSKPVANIVKNEAKKHPYVRKYIIIPIGKGYNAIEGQVLRRKSQTPDLTEEEIVELGSNAVGEIILFGLLSVILLAEYNRQGDKKAVVQRMKEDEISNLVTTVLEVIEEVNDLKKSVKKLQKASSNYDAIDREEELHEVVHDHDFLDVLLGSKKKFWRKEKNVTDINSPSI